jgi:hypothetical protein
MELSIKIGYDPQNKMYAFKTPSHNALNFRVNGKLVGDLLLGYRANGLVVTNEKPEIVTCDKISRIITGYINACNQKSFTISEYNTITDSIAKLEREYDEDDDQWIYKNVEDEIYVTRFFRNLKTNYENVTTVDVYELEFFTYPVSTFPEIIPLYSIDAKNIFETKCTYTTNIDKIFNETLLKYGISRLEIVMPSHSGISYVRLNGEYIAGTDAYQKRQTSSIVGTYDECVARRLKSYKDMEDIISMHLAKSSKTILDKGTVGNILTELTAIMSSVNGLKVSVKDLKSQNQLSVRIDNLIKTYKKLA